jgi:hypothetical protein
MPTEERRIIFSNAELYAALDRHLAGTGSGLPVGAITRVRGDEPHDLIKIDVATSEDDTATNLEFRAVQVGEALIGHCLANQIPLPRAFSKSLIITGDKVALQITNAVGGLVEKPTIWRSLRRRLIETLAILRVRKWSLIRASVYGLAFQIVVLWLSDQAWGVQEWGRVTFDLDSGTRQGMATAISALLPGPLLFVVGTWVRNAIVKRAKRSHQYSVKTLDFRFDEHRHQTAPLSTAFFALALAFSIVVLGGPLVVSQFEQVLQTQRSTPSVVLSNPTRGGAIALSPSSQYAPPAESDRHTDLDASSSPVMLVQKGSVKLSDASPVEVTFPKPFNGLPNVTVVSMDGSSADAVAVVENVTPNSFEIRSAKRTRTSVGTEFKWIAEGPSRE